MKVNVVSESEFTVQGHGVHSAFKDTVRQLRDYTEAKVVSNSRERADVIHLHTVGPYSLWQTWRRRGAKVVVSAHVTPASFLGSLVGAKYWYTTAKWYLRWFYNRADAVLAVSEEVIGELKAMGVKRPLYLVPNTIEASEFANTPELKAQARKQLQVAPDSFVVLGVGQVQPRKRIDTFVAAARKLPLLRFVWVGGMPFKALAADSVAMKEMMSSKPTNVTFTGMVGREVVVEWCRAADLFFLPSAQETFGLVIVEAAAAGEPLLLRDLEQYRLTFGEGYEKGDEATFAGQIERFATDRDFYKRWQEASAGVAKRYDAAQGAKRLMQVYGEVLASRGRRHNETRPQTEPRS